MAGVPSSSRGSSASSGITVVGYTELTTTVAITASSEGTANTIVTSGALTYTAVLHRIEVFFPRIGMPNVAGAQQRLLLQDGATVLGELALFEDPAAATARVTFAGSRFITPTAGSHTYLVSAYFTTSGGSVAGGAGGTGTALPGFIRVTTGS